MRIAKQPKGVYIVVINFGEGDEPCQIVYDNTGCRNENVNNSDKTIEDKPIVFNLHEDFPALSQCSRIMSDLFKDVPGAKDAIREYTVTLAILISKMRR